MDTEQDLKSNALAQHSSVQSTHSPRQTQGGRSRRAVHSGMTPRANEHGLGAARKRSTGKGQGHKQQHHYRGPRPMPRSDINDRISKSRQSQSPFDASKSRQWTRSENEVNNSADKNADGSNDDKNDKEDRGSMGSSVVSITSSSLSSTSSSISPRDDHMSSHSSWNRSSSASSSTSSSPNVLAASTSTVSTTPTSISSIIFPSPSSTTMTTTTSIMSLNSLSSVNRQSSFTPSEPSQMTTATSPHTLTTTTRSAFISNKHRNWKSFDNSDTHHSDPKPSTDLQHSLDTSSLSDDVFTPRDLEYSETERLKQTSAVSKFEEEFIVTDNQRSEEISNIDESLSGHPFIVQQEGNTSSLLCANVKTNLDTTNNNMNNIANIATKNDKNNNSSRNKDIRKVANPSIDSQNAFNSESKTHVTDNSKKSLSKTQNPVNTSYYDGSPTLSNAQKTSNQSVPPVLAKSAWLTNDHGQRALSSQTQRKYSSENSIQNSQDFNRSGKHCTNIERRAVLAAAAIHNPAFTASNILGGSSENPSSIHQQQQKRTHPLVKSKSSWRIHAARARESVANLISLVKFKDKESSSEDDPVGEITHGNKPRVEFLLPRNKSSPSLMDSVSLNNDARISGTEYHYSSSVDVLCGEASGENGSNPKCTPGDVDLQNENTTNIENDALQPRVNDTSSTQNTNTPFQSSCEKISDQVQDNLRYVREVVEEALTGSGSGGFESNNAIVHNVEYFTDETNVQSEFILELCDEKSDIECQLQGGNQTVNCVNSEKDTDHQNVIKLVHEDDMFYAVERIPAVNLARSIAENEVFEVKQKNAMEISDNSACEQFQTSSIYNESFSSHGDHLDNDAGSKFNVQACTENSIDKNKCLFDIKDNHIWNDDNVTSTLIKENDLCETHMSSEQLIPEEQNYFLHQDSNETKNYSIGVECDIVSNEFDSNNSKDATEEDSSVLKLTTPGLLETLKAAGPCLTSRKSESPNSQRKAEENIVPIHIGITSNDFSPEVKISTRNSSENLSEVDFTEENHHSEESNNTRCIIPTHSYSDSPTIENDVSDGNEFHQNLNKTQCGLFLDPSVNEKDINDIKSTTGSHILNSKSLNGESSSDSDEVESQSLAINDDANEVDECERLQDDTSFRKLSNKRRNSTSSLPSSKSSKKGSRRERSKRVEHLLNNQLFKKHLSKHADVIERKVFGIHNRCLKKSISNFDLSSAQSACIGNIVQNLVQSDDNDCGDESDENDDDKELSQSYNDSDDNVNENNNEMKEDEDLDVVLNDEKIRKRHRQKLSRTRSLYVSCHNIGLHKETSGHEMKEGNESNPETEQSELLGEKSDNKRKTDVAVNPVKSKETKDARLDISESPTSFGVMSHQTRSKRIHIPSFNEYKRRRQHSSTNNATNDDISDDTLPIPSNDIYVIDETDGDCKQSDENFLSSNFSKSVEFGDLNPGICSEISDKNTSEVRCESESDTIAGINSKSIIDFDLTNSNKEIKSTPRRKIANVFVHPAIVVTSEEYAGLEFKGRTNSGRQPHGLNKHPRSPSRSPIRERCPILGENVTRGDKDSDVDSPMSQQSLDKYNEHSNDNQSPSKSRSPDEDLDSPNIIQGATGVKKQQQEYNPETDSMLVSLGFTFRPTEGISFSQQHSSVHNRLEISKSLDLTRAQSPDVSLMTPLSSPSSSRSTSPIPFPASKTFSPSENNDFIGDELSNKSVFDQGDDKNLASQVDGATINFPRRQISQNDKQNLCNITPSQRELNRSSHYYHSLNEAPSTFEIAREHKKASVDVLELSDAAAGIDDDYTQSDDVKMPLFDDVTKRIDNALQRRSPESSASDSDNKTSVLRSISDVSTMLSDDKEKRRRERKERPYKSDPFVGINKRPTSLLSPECHPSMKDTLSPSTSCSFPSLEELAEQSDSNSMYDDDDEESRKRLNRLSTASSASEDSGVVNPLGGGDRKSEPNCSHCTAFDNKTQPILDATSPSSTSSSLASPTTTERPDIESLSSTPTSSMCSKCVMKRRERKETIQEIAETEKRYGRDLAILKDEFYRPIKGTSLLTLDQLDAIFLNLDDLISAHKKFMDKLTSALVEAVRHGDEGLSSVEVGSVFVDSSTMFLAFENYCIHQAGSSTMLEQMEKEKELLKLFLQVAQNENPKLRRMHLKSFLMSPVQRVMKYPLLLGRLYKTTPCYHGDKNNIRQAQEKIEDILEHINNKTHSVIRPKSRNQSGGALSYSLGDKIEVNRVALEVLGWPKREVCDILTSRLWYGQMPDVTWASKRARNVKFSMVHAALLSHGKPKDDSLKSSVKQVALVLVREKGGKYSLVKDPFLMDRCVVTVDSTYDHVFELHEQGKDTYLFKADHSKQTKVWSKKLQDLSRKLGFWRRRRNGLPNILLKAS